MSDLGGPNTYEVYSVEWAWAMNSPLPWVKQIASHLGGMTNGVVVSWPKRIHSQGAIRSQFTHLVDVTPTILDAAGIPAPESVDGIKQEPFDGISLLPTFDKKTELPRTQYFEMTANIGIYHDGWFANTVPRRMPWEHAPRPEEAAKPVEWELYDLEHDFSQSHNVAAKFPAKLKELQGIFDAEAQRNHVYPIKNIFVSKEGLRGNPSVHDRKSYDFWGTDTTLLSWSAPSFAGRSFTITADITTQEATSGVILADGSKFSGWSFFLDQGKPVAVHALSEKPGEATRIASEKVLPPGDHKVRFVFVSQGGAFAPGVMHIETDGVPVAEGAIPRTAMVISGESESLDIGRDTGVPVADYHVPEGRFEGAIHHVYLVFDGNPPPQDKKRAPD